MQKQNIKQNNKKVKIKAQKINKKWKKIWFTLVELIVVITIIAILGTIAFISFQSYTKQARDWTRIADLNNIKKSMTLYGRKMKLSSSR